jgi:predicted nucleic-acid-binding protein
MSIMEEVSKILKIYVTEKTIDEDVRVLEIQGKLDQRKIRELMVMIIKHIHDRESSTTV